MCNANKVLQMLVHGEGLENLPHQHNHFRAFTREREREREREVKARKI